MPNGLVFGGLDDVFEFAAREANENAGDATDVVEKGEALGAEGAPNGFVAVKLEDGFEVDPLLKRPLVWGAAPNGFEAAPNGFVGGEVEEGFEVDALLKVPFVWGVTENGFVVAPNGLVVGF